MTDPYPKSRQLARGERRYRRKVASPKQWQAIIEAKQGPCRVCAKWGTTSGYPIEYHHIIPRSLGGDDVVDNVIPLCSVDHRLVTENKADRLRIVAESLTDAEYTYVIGKLGEGAMERLFGVGA